MWTLLLSFLQWFFLHRRPSLLPLLCVLLLLCNADCALTMGDLEYSAPQAGVVFICDKPLDVPPNINLWAYDTVTGRIVTAEDPGELRYFAGVAADMLFQYDRDAPAASVKKMPERFGLACRKPKSFLPDSTAVFPVEQSCPIKVAETLEQSDRPDPRFFAAPPGSKPRHAKKKDPLRVHVCVRPSWVREGVNEWAMIKDLEASRLTPSAKEFAEKAANAEAIFILDDNAPPESVYWFVTDPAQLSCPNKPPPKPYKYIERCGMLEWYASADTRADELRAGNTSGNGKTASGSGGQGTGQTATTSNPNDQGDGQTTETSSPDGKGPPLNFLESLSRNLQYVAAIARGDTSGSAKDPNGARYGMLGGKNEGGPDFLLLQMAAGTFSIIQNPFKTGKQFVETITTAVSAKRTAVILDPKVLTKEMAEKLAENPTEAQVEKALNGEIVESYGKAMAASLQEARVIMPYSRAQIFTAGWEAKYQAHHLLEVNMFETLKLGSAEHGPAVILTKAEHGEISAELAKARNDLMATVKKRGQDALPTEAEVWQMYQQVYNKYPNWLKAIKGYFPSVP